MDLRCNKTNCKYNFYNACDAKEVCIARDSSCKTYEKDLKKTPDKLQDVSKTMFEAAPNIAGYKHNEKLNISCIANCLFNKRGHCNANGVTILNKKDGLCGTYIEE